MSKTTRSARGEVVNFDLLIIKQQLAVTPVPVSVDQRRKFIDEKDGIKARTTTVLPQTQVAPVQAAIPSALMMSVEAANVSAKAAEKSKTKV
jgi:hypothetical protein